MRVSGETQTRKKTAKKRRKRKLKNGQPPTHTRSSLLFCNTQKEYGKHNTTTSTSTHPVQNSNGRVVRRASLSGFPPPKNKSAVSFGCLERAVARAHTHRRGVCFFPTLCLEEIHFFLCTTKGCCRKRPTAQHGHGQVCRLRNSWRCDRAGFGISLVCMARITSLCVCDVRSSRGRERPRKKLDVDLRVHALPFSRNSIPAQSTHAATTMQRQHQGF